MMMMITKVLLMLMFWLDEVDQVVTAVDEYWCCVLNMCGPMCWQLSNLELYWVVAEICSEPNVVRRVKIIQLFIKLASKNFV